MKLFRFILLLSAIILFSTCATFKMQISENQDFIQEKDTTKLVHSFYLIGDAGNSTLKEDSPSIKFLRNQMKDAPKNSTLLFLGDNVYEKSIP